MCTMYNNSLPKPAFPIASKVHLPIRSEKSTVKLFELSITLNKSDVNCPKSLTGIDTRNAGLATIR